MENRKLPYKLSRDYNRLKKLLDDKLEIVCFVNYRYHDDNPEKIPYRDICRARFHQSDDEKYQEYSFSVRGICYRSWHPSWVKEYENYITFEEMCSKMNVEFIDIEP